MGQSRGGSDRIGEGGSKGDGERGDEGGVDAISFISSLDVSSNAALLSFEAYIKTPPKVTYTIV